MRSLILLLGLLATGAALADEPVRRGIPIEYVSPGASGSVSESSRSQRYDVYGGHAIPSEGYGRNRVEIQGGSSVQQRGGIRQSIEYPGGIEVQRYPGRNSYEVQRNR
ncbi:hypothetical protein [Pseudomonas subflava]|uniref:hypothetical protein n=1 Tax=Pseudomonas subflava TaxID=2952933 RepID=UPI00207A6E0B|nr:hypothetical protein [Pseudomonas subflava]